MGRCRPEATGTWSTLPNHTHDFQVFSTHSWTAGCGVDGVAQQVVPLTLHLSPLPWSVCKEWPNIGRSFCCCLASGHVDRLVFFPLSMCKAGVPIRAGMMAGWLAGQWVGLKPPVNGPIPFLSALPFLDSSTGGSAAVEGRFFAFPLRFLFCQSRHRLIDRRPRDAFVVLCMLLLLKCEPECTSLPLMWALSVLGW